MPPTVLADEAAVLVLRARAAAGDAVGPLYRERISCSAVAAVVVPSWRGPQHPG